MAKDAWFAAASTATARLRGLPPPRVRLSTDAEVGFRLAGTIWPIDAGRTRIRLALEENGVARATARFDIATVRLPPEIARTLDPATRQPGTGFAPLLGSVSVSTDRLEMEVSGRANPVYRACADTTPDAFAACDALEIRLRSGRAGHALCLALGDDGAFGLLAPAAHYGAPAIGPDRWTRLPQDLPPASDGGRVVWPALGDPGATLVLCALFEVEGLLPLAALTPFDGQRLAPADVAAVAEVLRDASPLSTAHAIVTLISDDLD